MIKKSLKSKTSKSHTWAPLKEEDCYLGESERDGEQGKQKKDL
jgi:hypothetical protein